MFSFQLISFFHQPCHYFRQNLRPYNPSLIGRLHEIKSVCQQAIKRIIFSRFTTQRKHKKLVFSEKGIMRHNLILFRSFSRRWMSSSELSFFSFCVLFQHSVRRYRWIHGNFIDILCSRLGENSERTFCTLRSIGGGEFCIKLFNVKGTSREVKSKNEKSNTKSIRKMKKYHVVHFVKTKYAPLLVYFGRGNWKFIELSVDDYVCDSSTVVIKQC